MTERDFYLSSHLNSFAIFVFVPTVQNLERQGVKKKTTVKHQLQNLLYFFII